VIVMRRRLVAYLGCALLLGLGPSGAQEASTTQSLGSDTRADAQKDEELPPTVDEEPLDEDAELLPAFAPASEQLTDLLDASLQALIAEADQKDQTAMMAVARAYFAHADVEERAKGVPYLEKAAEAGSVEALLLLGAAYSSGTYGVSPDPAKAIDAYERAIEANSIDATVALGRLLLTTDFTPEGQARAIELLNKGASEGRTDAINALGGIYARGRGVSADANRAMRYYAMGIMAGDRASLVAAGDLLRSGATELPADPMLARELFERASLVGDLGAQRRLAEMHLRGEGTAPDPLKAVELFTELAEAGDTSSFVTLGDLFGSGEFVPADGAKAVSYYERAATSGNAAGILRLAETYLNGAPGIDADPAKGIEYYERAIETGSTAAMRALANIFLAGDFVPANAQRGIDLLTAAASRGDGAAAETLAVLHTNNDPFPADIEVVRRNLEIALLAGNTRAALRVAAGIAQGPLARDHMDMAYQLLSNAVAGGVPGAAAELARLQLAGSFPAESLSGIMTMLNDAARNGDIDAARFLLGLYRDGSGLLLRPDPVAAETFLASVEPILGGDATAYERVVMLAERGDSPANLEAITAQFEHMSKDNGLLALDLLRRLNARAYVYVLQQRLAQRGLYDGPLSGTLDGQTIRAFLDVCAEAGAQRDCAQGPMTAVAAEILGDKIYEPH
jgi:TPR repeat protein